MSEIEKGLIKIEGLPTAFHEWGEVHTFMYGVGAAWGITVIAKIPEADANEMGHHYVYFVAGNAFGRFLQALFVLAGAKQLFGLPIPI